MLAQSTGTQQVLVAPIVKKHMPFTWVLLFVCAFLPQTHHLQSLSCTICRVCSTLSDSLSQSSADIQWLMAVGVTSLSRRNLIGHVARSIVVTFEGWHSLGCGYSHSMPVLVRKGLLEHVHPCSPTLHVQTITAVKYCAA